ncbi:hypothetical protein TSUD_51760 [Trifolium subterraneum]|uniref:Zinc-finger domain-containing protein n=1 Tax=Trifolium subterraneum TaxID=3900 RepID=A0A2Z6MP69_TRISU|nr:hypothetical protein TSUD_51760 [Trifolium subterraneum]
MADEKNNTTVSVTLTEESTPDDGEKTTATVDVAAETVPIVAETVLLNDSEGKSSVKEAEESVPDREKQAVNIVPETTLLKDDAVSVEVNDVAAGDSSSVKVPVAPVMYGRRKKKKRGRKSFAEIERMKKEREALMKTSEDGTKEETGKGDDDVAAEGSISVEVGPSVTGKKRGRKRKTEKEVETGEGADVAVEDSGSVDVRKSERPKKKISFKELEEWESDEELKKKGKRGRKKKIIADSDENNVAAEEGENMKKDEKKKPGRKKKETFSSGEEFEAEKKGEDVKKEKKKPGRKKKEIFGSGDEFEAEQKVEDVKKEKKKPGRKKKENFSSGEEFEAGQKGEDMKKEKKKPGRKRKTISEEGENGGTIKSEDELVGEKMSESDVLKEEDQDRCEIDTPLSDDNKGYSLRRTAAAKRPKYIEPKIQYPHLKEDEIAKACPVCCDNCNCKACLRSTTLIKAIKDSNPQTNKDFVVEPSKYMLKELLPYLRRMDEEQMAEKEIEAKRQGLPLSELQIEVADCPKNERVYW